jgi:DNA-binding transcriptional regulator YiaG
MTKVKQITKDRVESKVEKIPESGCWVWMGTTTSRGYGQIISDNKTFYAHRAAYQAFIGDIPEGMNVCHHCDNRFCVNPSHLFLGSQKDNLQDMKKKGRSTAGEKNAKSKLTEKYVKEIKQGLKDGLSTKTLATIYSVSTSTINFIKQGKRWNHV